MVSTRIEARRHPVVPSTMSSDVDLYGFSAGHIAQGLVFISGQLGFDTDGTMPLDPAAQGVNALTRLVTVLKAAGCTPADVVELRTFHIGSPAAANPWFLPAKAHLFTHLHPAWTAVGVASLAVETAVIEIAATAVVPQAQD